MEISFVSSILPYLKIVLSCFLALLLSATLTGLVRLYALHKAILDIPNERSSHQIPTPRGGGIAIALTFILSLLWLNYQHLIATNLMWAIIGGGSAVGIISYCDDIRSIKIRWRILVHFLAAVWALYWIGGCSTLEFGAGKIDLNLGGTFLTIVGIVWCINLYNFMDGIDGLAGSEGMFIGLVSGAALCLAGAFPLALTIWLLTAAIAGFTLWNWPPAKIFLGDVGSSFLGYTFAVIALYTINNNFLPFSFWWIIAGIFICDATFTLLSRMYQRKRWYSAHREHAFQHIMTFGANHKQVTLSIIVLNCCVLLPAACATLYWPAQAFWIMVVSTLCLWITWSWIKSLRADSFIRDLEISPETTSN